MSNLPYLVLPIAQVPVQTEWLNHQPLPVIAIGEGDCANADIVLAEEKDLDIMLPRIERAPMAAMILVQVLRAVEQLSVANGVDIESLAYATLQDGPEFKAWLETREAPPQLIQSTEGDPLIMNREGDTLRVTLNRPENRNALSVEMRDALVELFELVNADASIEHVHLSGAGACFSVGGELREFGLAPNSLTAHWIRSTHNPSRLLARCAKRVSCHLHSACIGSGIELPAFASHVSAAKKTYFQLPELKFGLIPGAGGCVSILRRIGRQRTAWLALSGKKINADTALEWGLIDEIID